MLHQDRNGKPLNVGDYVWVNPIELAINLNNLPGKIISINDNDNEYPYEVEFLNNKIQFYFLEAEVTFAREEEIIIWKLEN